MQIETLGDAYTHSVRIRLRCAWGKRDAMKSVRECLFSAELDVQTLVCTRGRDMPLTFAGSHEVPVLRIKAGSAHVRLPE